MGEVDVMVCRACGNEERASEGYPCDNCGTFICQICNLKGVTLCATCEALADVKARTPGETEPPAS